MKAYITDTGFIVLIILGIFTIPVEHPQGKFEPSLDWELEGVLAAFDDADPKVTLRALKYLTTDGLHLIPAAQNRLYNHPKFKQIIDGDQGDEIRQEILQILYELPRLAEPYQDALAHLARNHKSLLTRLSSVIILGKLVNITRGNIQLLVTLLQDESLRDNAAEALVRQGEKVQPEIDNIAKLLDDKQLCWTALDTLKRLGRVSEKQLPKIVALLSDGDPRLRATALGAIGSMGEASRQFISQVNQRLDDPSPEVQSAAIQAVVNLSSDQASAAALLSQRLNDTPSVVRITALNALGRMGASSNSFSLAMAKQLTARESEVANAAIRALGAIPGAAERHLSEIASLLDKPETREATIAVMGSVGPPAQRYSLSIARLLPDHSHMKEGIGDALERIGGPNDQLADYFFQLLKNGQMNPRLSAMQALDRMRGVRLLLIPRTPELLADSNPLARDAGARLPSSNIRMSDKQLAEISRLLERPEIRGDVIAALAASGPVAKAHAPEVAAYLNQANVPEIIAAAASALRSMEAVKPYEKEISPLLKHRDSRVRIAAIAALGTLGDAYAEVIASQLSGDHECAVEAMKALSAMGSARRFAPQIAPWLKKDFYNTDSREAASALQKMAPLDEAGVLAILAVAYQDTSNAADYRFTAYLLGGAVVANRILANWLGRPPSFPPVMTVENGVITLEILERAWTRSQLDPALRSDIEEQIASVVQNAPWRVTDLNLIKRQVVNLESVKSNKIGPIRNVVLTLRIKFWSFVSLWAMLGHAIFWGVMIAVYPYSPRVQAEVFWNKQVREFFGLFYVGLLFRHVPQLRARLFAPFREPLTGEALLDQPQEGDYFPNSSVQFKDRNGDQTYMREQTVLDALLALKGRAILEGESGLGKTMFIRYLVKRSSRLTVYLPAARCANGVLSAIQNKLLGVAQDNEFLQALIYSGGLDVCIDGLNEVTADTRAKINQFVEGNPFANILLATQPLLDWEPPAGTRVFNLQPLKPDQIMQFLLSRNPNRTAGATVSAKQYEQVCREYVEEALNPQQAAEHLDAVSRVLSNPMDLTITAQMLACNEAPDLFRLQEQQYRVMSQVYQRTQQRAFPLATFSERVYSMRLNDEVVLPWDEFPEEITMMSQHKMVYSRHYVDSTGKSITRWYFRHDKITEYFILQTFLGQDNNRPKEHLSDPRFRGVFFLMATQLPFEAAVALREDLVMRAANTHDHSVSDTFVQLVHSRRAIERSAPSWVVNYPLPEQHVIEHEMESLWAERNELSKKYEEYQQRLQEVIRFRILIYETQSTALLSLVLDALQSFAAQLRPPRPDDIADAIIQGPDRQIYLIDVKARLKSLTDADLAQPYASHGVSDGDPRHVGGKRIVVANTNCTSPPEDRPSPFSDACITAAQRLGICLMTTTQLFNALCLSQQNQIALSAFWQALHDHTGYCPLPELMPATDRTP